MNNSYIHPSAKIGTGTQIEPFAVIYDDVEIGKNCKIHSHVTIFQGARIGDDCEIFPGASIAAVPQDLKFAGEYTTCRIGNNNRIRESVTINRGTAASGATIVGNDNLIMAYSHIAHDCRIGNHCVLANNTTLGGHVEIDDWAVAGGFSAIHQFVKIGQHAILMGGALVDKDVPPYVKAAKFPLSYYGVNAIGLERRGFIQEHITEIHNIYRVLFQSGLPYSEAIKEIKKLPKTERLQVILDFISRSERGLMRGFNNKDNDLNQ
ncbi:MAG: acyl-ACP--UDP-N-acetylglucosamine O-acyltransferase [Bacteroidales bacterium]|jgi:UDP-N-acetylglucosamine acyltransferase|nr:acyl-ACP--UDP-N-acetylglucosamine O-acyltransferase [Bacteroidales bacterium]